MTSEDEALRILITGFGPFPGMPVNISARLADLLARAGRVRWPQHMLEPSILPTEWAAGPEKLDWLWDTFKPDIALHFGVSADADGLQLETTGRNRCRADADAAGLKPLSSERLAGGPEACAATLPLARIQARLEEIGVAGSLSEDAGAYLCNAILYDSLQRADAVSRAAIAGFVHIPVALSESMTIARSPAAARQLSWGAAVAGGLAILDCSIEKITALRRDTGDSCA